MMLLGKRKDVEENNNYINKYGKITHICPKCKNLYQVDIKFDIECTMLRLDSIITRQERDSYQLELPQIKKRCNCGEDCIQIDNSISKIVKIFMEKNYKVIHSCEGHMYSKKNKYYTLPSLKIEGDLYDYITPKYYGLFDIRCEFGVTTITGAVELDKYTKVEFRNIKSTLIKLLEELAVKVPLSTYIYYEKPEDK